MGPTKLKPGPTLLRQARLAVKFVSKSRSSREINKVPLRSKRK